MGLLERLGLKRATVPFDAGSNLDYTRTNYLMPWAPVTWFDTSWKTLVDEIYLINSAVAQCILKLTLGFPEPPPQVMVKDDPQPQHPLQLLLNRPNPQMSHSELMVYTIVYRAVGGNVYLHKVRNSSGGVVELWPYHSGQMWPIPSRFGWVEEYEYEVRPGDRRRIPSSDIIHLKWPLPDLSAPYLALSPLIAIAREVMSDTEATRFQTGLLKNDATPRGVITLPGGISIPPKKAQQLREEFDDRHGGDNRGGVLFLENGGKYERISLDMQQLAFDQLRRVPETRIAGAFGVPPIVAGLSVGLERATYSNYEQAVVQMTRGTFVPLWRSDAVELTQALQNEFSGSPVVTYDTTQVAALQESEDKQVARAVSAFSTNAVVVDEFRAWIGLPPLDQVKPGDTRGLCLSYELPLVPAPEFRPVIDVLPQEQVAQLEDSEA